MSEKTCNLCRILKALVVTFFADFFLCFAQCSTGMDGPIYHAAELSSRAYYSAFRGVCFLLIVVSPKRPISISDYDHYEWVDLLITIFSKFFRVLRYAVIASLLGILGIFTIALPNIVAVLKMDLARLLWCKFTNGKIYVHNKNLRRSKPSLASEYVDGSRHRYVWRLVAKCDIDLKFGDIELHLKTVRFSAKLEVCQFKSFFDIWMKLVDTSDDTGWLCVTDIKVSVGHCRVSFPSRLCANPSVYVSAKLLVQDMLGHRASNRYDHSSWEAVEGVPNFATRSPHGMNGERLEGIGHNMQKKTETTEMVSYGIPGVEKQTQSDGGVPIVRAYKIPPDLPIVMPTISFKVNDAEICIGTMCNSESRPLATSGLEDTAVYGSTSKSTDCQLVCKIVGCKIMIPAATVSAEAPAGSGDQADAVAEITQPSIECTAQSVSMALSMTLSVGSIWNQESHMAHHAGFRGAVLLGQFQLLGVDARLSSYPADGYIPTCSHLKFDCTKELLQKTVQNASSLVRAALIKVDCLKGGISDEFVYLLGTDSLLRNKPHNPTAVASAAVKQQAQDMGMALNVGMQLLSPLLPDLSSVSLLFGEVGLTVGSSSLSASEYSAAAPAATSKTTTMTIAANSSPCITP